MEYFTPSTIEPTKGVRKGLQLIIVLQESESKSGLERSRKYSGSPRSLLYRRFGEEATAGSSPEKFHQLTLTESLTNPNQRTSDFAFSLNRGLKLQLWLFFFLFSFTFSSKVFTLSGIWVLATRYLTSRPNAVNRYKRAQNAQPAVDPV